MQAKLGHNPSYIWRSLLWSRDILEHGLLWRVGNGKSIHLFEDKWIPSIQSKVGVPLIPWSYEPKVCSLIKNGSWDEELILSSFNRFIAGEILKIPLTSQTMKMFCFGVMIIKAATPWMMDADFSAAFLTLRYINRYILMRNGGLSFGAYPYLLKYDCFGGVRHIIAFRQNWTCFVIMFR